MAIISVEKNGQKGKLERTTPNNTTSPSHFDDVETAGGNGCYYYFVAGGDKKGVLPFTTNDGDFEMIDGGKHTKEKNIFLCPPAGRQRAESTGETSGRC